MNIDNLHKVVFSVGRITPQGVNLLGTCFSLEKPGLFATASHVTNNDNNNLVVFLSSNTDLTKYQDTSNNKGEILPVEIFKVDPVRDICILKMEHGAQSNISIGSSDEVRVTDNVSILGYPHCVNGRNVLTYQTTVIGAKYPSIVPRVVI